MNFARAWSFLGYAAARPDHQQFLLVQRPPPNQHFLLLFYADKASHGGSWDHRKPTSFLMGQTNIYIKNIQLFLTVWITGLLISCLRVACLVLKASEHNY